MAVPDHLPASGKSPGAGKAGSVVWTVAGGGVVGVGEGVILWQEESSRQITNIKIKGTILLVFSRLIGQSLRNR